MPTTITPTCGVPSLTLGPCDLPWGHGGLPGGHSSDGDGFFARCWRCREPLPAEGWGVVENVFGYVCRGECDAQP